MDYQLPDRVPLAQLPTPVQPLARLTEEVGGPHFFVKRDDLTGAALSGNKIRKLEFSHGHNMLTLNGLYRLPARIGRISPYLGVGAGISIPHSEIQFREDLTRTYEYQYTGPAFQALFGSKILILFIFPAGPTGSPSAQCLISPIRKPLQTVTRPSVKREK